MVFGNNCSKLVAQRLPASMRPDGRRYLVRNPLRDVGPAPHHGRRDRQRAWEPLSARRAISAEARQPPKLGGPTL